MTWAHMNETNSEGEHKDATDCPKDKGQQQGDRVASIICKQGYWGGGNAGDGAWGVKKVDEGCASSMYKGLGSVLIVLGKWQAHCLYRAAYC